MMTSKIAVGSLRFIEPHERTLDLDRGSDSDEVAPIIEGALAAIQRKPRG
jgi:hypothetical protein